MPDIAVINGVESGCTVTVSGLTASVAAGSVRINNITYSIPATTAGLAAADSSLDRYDLVAANSAGGLTVGQGTPGSGFGDNLAAIDGAIELSQHLVPAGSTTCSNEDKRNLFHADISPYKLSGRWYLSSTATFVNGTDYSGNHDKFAAMPYYTAKTIAIQSLGFKLTGTNANSGSIFRTGVYRDDGAGNLSLLVDAGTIAVDSSISASVKTVSVTSSLAPGWYWLGGVLQGWTSGTINFLEFSQNANAAFLPLSPVGVGAIGNDDIGSIVQTNITGALPSILSSISYTQTRVPVIGIQAT